MDKKSEDKPYCTNNLQAYNNRVPLTVKDGYVVTQALLR